MSGKPNKSPYQTPGYPTQGYPTAGYPTQQYQQGPPGYSSSFAHGSPAPGMTVTHMAQSYQSPGAYGAPPQGPPPPYSYAPPQQGYPTQQGGYPTQQGGYPTQQPQPFVANNVFDSGARFDGIAQPNIPPPPPGYAPNAAQYAQMQGQTVIGTQQRSNFWTGGSGGGYTLGGL
ncbi:uncharacterized protein LOC143063223 [Mytilus galloprovincialis]|uniref:uncharacterized protein LOC143063223 n=1 Tax=Mytilus galloprovincialis TaxID=29158 RepID=UPI003F7C85DF